MKKNLLLIPAIIILSLLIFKNSSYSQVDPVIHQVTVQNFQFSPSTLVINEGDIVEWTNIDGFHNVNGTFATYPGNTQSFGNSPAGVGWTYSFTFTTAGSNSYRCDIHPAAMQGSVTVLAVFDCPQLNGNIGDACDDGIESTINDVITEECNCEGTPLPPNTLSGNVNWNTACGSRAVSVKFYEPGSSNLINTYNTMIDEDGNFLLEDVQTGAYDILIKVEAYLQKGFASFVIEQGSNALIAGAITLGDIDNSNGVNINDITVLTQAFGSEVGDANFEPLADFDCNNNVNINDFTAIIPIFGLSGDDVPLN